MEWLIKFITAALRNGFASPFTVVVNGGVITTYCDGKKYCITVTEVTLSEY